MAPPVIYLPHQWLRVSTVRVFAVQGFEDE